VAVGHAAGHATGCGEGLTVCAQFPAQIVSLEGGRATVQAGSRTRQAATLLFDDLQVGDWVLVAAGTVIHRLTAADARQLTEDVSQVTGEQP
jgi:hydrogenase assembly chaperone HypC/HupF